MANRKFRVVDSETSNVQTASVWGATELTKDQCETLDAYAKVAKQTPAAFLGGLMLAAFLAHVAANPLPVAETAPEAKAEGEGETEKSEADAIAAEGSGQVEQVADEAAETLLEQEVAEEQETEKATGTEGRSRGRGRRR